MLLLFLSYFLALPTSKRNSSAEITDPTNNDTRYMTGLLTPPARTANIPPCGAVDTEPNCIDKAPATPAPTNNDGITLAGFDAANGIAPSVIKARPIT